MNFSNGDKASFFKILLNDSVDYLTLPTAFAKKFLENSNNKKQTLVLKPKSAVKWIVKYSKNEDKHYFKDGWLKFVNDNLLQVGDFLVFWLLSASPNSSFQVFFYEPNGCLKHPVSSSGSFRSILPTADRRLLLVDKVTAEVMRGGAGDGMIRCVKEETSNNHDEGDDDDDDSLQKVHKSIRKVLRKSYLHQLPMTMTFWKASRLNRYDSVRLRTNEGKIWKVGVSKYGKINFPNLTSGWYDFWKSNDIKKSNTLQFTHVKGNLLHVHVIKRHKGRTINKKTS
ncbi:putative B3 domain-containing protein Os03g0621600 [Lactuca sativa]|uniref:TF-B3 domain-containing protein n=1 Tax=Lactuca sativa TaxID=4236 RepID=A0A9R1W3X3_LACSA|nr:putative B3 domain-containing protein Os03g0621600 [Lactuca sativa]KAJ0215730.1 hypothetical protein LSAT_V11C300136160 [Lactuca sativa]